MPHVSQKQINKKVLQKLSDLLFSSITNKNVTRKQQQLAFGELFTPTEKIMLGKRLAAIHMLSQGVSPYKIGKALQLSHTTTMKLQVRHERGTISNIEKMCNILQKGPLANYIENLFKPLPRYGTSPSAIFKEM
jgi:hypothetical protein